ncbi:MAG: MFS transporter [Candidatus Odinarchaeota archaeon]
MNSVTSTDLNKDSESTLRYWRRRVFVTVWITYMLYYVGRVNISIAITPMLLEFDHLTKTVMGGVTTALFITYAIGQFVNGQLGDAIGGRRLVTIGLVGSAAVNLLFGFSDGIVVAMMVLWAFNGIFQSMGWAPSVKTVSNWVESAQRGRWSSFLGSSYQVGGIVSWIIASTIIDILGMDWRYSFWIAGIILFLSATHFYWRARSSPAEVGLTAEKNPLIEAESNHHVGFKNAIATIMTNRNVWFAAFGLFCLNIIRYGFTDWLPTYVTSDDVLITVAKKILFPLAGSLGGISAVYVSDRYLMGRRMPITAGLFVLLAAAIWVFSIVPADDVIIAMAFIALIGYLTFAPHVILVTTMPMEFTDPKTTSSATGFIDGWGYIGAACTGIGSGWILDATNDNWSFLFVIWSIIALMAFAVLILNRNGEKTTSS